MTTGPIWIIGDVRTSRHWQNSLKVLAKARPLADAARAPLAMILMGAARTDPSMDESPMDQPQELSACLALDAAARQAVHQGLQTVYCIEHPDLAVPRTDVYAQVLADLVRQYRPWLVLLTLNDFGRETAAFCAQHCRTGLIADCTELLFQDGQVLGRCPAWGGQILADITLAEGWSTAFITVQPHGAADIPEATVLDGRIEKIVPE